MTRKRTPVPKARLLLSPLLLALASAARCGRKA